MALTVFSMPKSDWATHAQASAVQNKALNNTVSWQTDASVDLLDYTTYHSSNTRQIAVDSGPHLAIKSGVMDLYLPAGMTRMTLGGMGYTTQASFLPQISHLVTKSDLLVYSAGLTRTLYDTNTPRDVTSSSLGLSWQHVLGNLWTVAPLVRITSEHARSNSFDNFATTAGLSLSGNLPWGLRFSASSLYTWANYKAPEAWASMPRRDIRRNNSLSLTKDLGGGYYASLSFADLDTSSNLELYATAKQQFQLQISKAF